MQSRWNIEVSKLRLYIEVFNRLAKNDREKEVDQARLIEKLLMTDRFTNDDIRIYTEKSLQNGQIFERKPGFLMKS